MRDIILYEAEDGKTSLDVHIDHETVCLNQRQMADLFAKDSDTIGLHILNVYKEGELVKEGTTEESSVVQTEGGRMRFHPKERTRLWAGDALD